MASFSAIILAGGKGKRMGSELPKQLLPLWEQPILSYSLCTFEESPVDEIVLVVPEGCEEEYRNRFLLTYHLRKVSAIVAGGKERYDSVMAGLEKTYGDYVLIHDGARPFVTVDTIRRVMDAAEKYNACVAGMPAKDTIKRGDSKGFAVETPDRSTMWTVQTPQGFSTELIKRAYESYFSAGKSGATDDAMIVEEETDVPVKLVEGSYDNIKITTPEDIYLGEAILRQRQLQN